MRNLPSYPSDAPQAPFVARLLALRDGSPIEPATRSPFEEGTVNGVVVRLGFAAPEVPVPPAGNRVTGFEIIPVQKYVPFCGNEHGTPADAIRDMLSAALRVYELVAHTGDADGFYLTAKWDFTARTWGPWLPA